MTEYYNNDLFMEPKTNQYGSHMVMTNVNKQTKIKLINVDTKFRDEYNYLQTSNYNITLPERITDVKSIEIKNIEVPITFYNISMNLGNNYFKIINISTNAFEVITIPDGQYNGSNLATTINNLIANSSYTNLNYGYDGSKSFFKITIGYPVKVEFDIDNKGNNDKYNFKSKLGWILGFRNTTYTITGTDTISEAFVDLNGPRYLYLAIDEFNKGNQNSFINPLFGSMINKKIIARMAMNNIMFPYGNVASFTRYNGLSTDIRNYTGIIDLYKLNVQILNENGIPMQLNGLDFSFLLSVTHE